MIRFSRLMRIAAVCVLAFAARTSAQGAGSTGAQALQFLAGGRAAALTGAYSAVSADVDALFYNPAGIADLKYGVSLAYETFVEDIAFFTFAGSFKVGRFSLGVSSAVLGAGEVLEVRPDPVFGGNTGLPTGETVSANEIAAKLSVAMPVGDRMRIGASAGTVSSSLAEQSTSAAVIDLGVQYDLSFGTVAASIRNAGPSLSGGEMADADLPTEARLGTVLRLDRPNGLGVALHTDVVARLHESSAGILVGVEGGYHATSQRALGAVARVGFSGAEGDGSLGALKLGAGISLSALAIDYTYQSLEFFGAVHRFGVRWSVPR